MGMTARAHLAYGCVLGSAEDFKAAERDEYGGPKLPWLPVDEDGDPVLGDFTGAAEKVLLISTGFTEADWRVDGYFERKREAEQRLGVEFDFSGHGDYAGWLLIAKSSGRSVEWSEVMTLDLEALADRPAREGWDDKLAAALKALGITPTQAAPKWLVFPSYG